LHCKDSQKSVKNLELKLEGLDATPDASNAKVATLSGTVTDSIVL